MNLDFASLSAGRSLSNTRGACGVNGNGKIRKTKKVKQGLSPLPIR
jgi:hypothetical protein